jgi:signal transduction histidine kinase
MPVRLPEGLKDRAETLGGHLRLRSLPGAGTTLEIDLPLEAGGTKQPPELGW